MVLSSVLTVAEADVFQYVYNNLYVLECDTETMTAKLVSVSGTVSGTGSLPNRISTQSGQMTIVEIGEEALMSQPLTSFSLPSTLKVIGKKAFSQCTNMQTITLPNSLTELGDQAFASCNALASITVPVNVTTVGTACFANCSSLSSVVFEDSNSVTSLGEWAFSTCSSLQSVVLPVGLTELPNHAFYNCVRLSNVSGGNALTAIDDYAFDGCVSLASFEWHENLNAIGSYAFRSTALREINLPASVSELGTGVFAKSKVKHFGLDDLDSITLIGEELFMDCDSLVSAEVSTRIHFIPAKTFSNCISLTTVELPEGISSIEGQGFYRCKALTNIALPSTVKTIGGMAFAYDTGLTSITLPEALTAIKTSAFNGCTNLATVSFNRCLTSLGVAAFQDCKALTTVEIPDLVSEIKNGCFSGCSNLGTVTLPAQIGSLEQDAFSGCPVLNTVKIMAPAPPAVDFTTAGLSSLSSIELHCPAQALSGYSDDPTWGAFPNIIGDMPTFSDGFVYTLSAEAPFTASLTKHYLPYGATSYTAPSVVSLYDNSYALTGIGNYVFRYLSSLRELDLGDVKTIGTGAFQKCTGLGTVNFRNVEVVGGMAFRDVAALTAIDLPASLKEVGTGAFNNAQASTLKRVTCRALTPPDAGSIFFSTTFLNNSTLFVPEESLERYKNNTKWNRFATILPIVIPGDIDGDGQIDSSDVSALLEIVLAGGELTPHQLAAGDIDGSGEIDSSDISALLEIVLSGN